MQQPQTKLVRKTFRDLQIGAEFFMSRHPEETAWTKRSSRTASPNGERSFYFLQPEAVWVKELVPVFTPEVTITYRQSVYIVLCPVSKFAVPAIMDDFGFAQPVPVKLAAFSLSLDHGLRHPGTGAEA